MTQAINRSYAPNVKLQKLTPLFSQHVCPVDSRPATNVRLSFAKGSYDPYAVADPGIHDNRSRQERRIGAQPISDCGQGGRLAGT
jgi:hypothetical protein